MPILTRQSDLVTGSKRESTTPSATSRSF